MSNSVAVSPASNGALIQVSNLTKIYQTEAGTIHVLKDINLKVYPGEIVAVMGPSGSGKSTFLFILGIFISPTMGSYILGGRDVLRLDRNAQAEFRRNRVGFVFQSCDLLENSTVYENLEFPLIYAGVDRRERPDRIAAALDLVNLGHRIHHSSNRLSGGERQRVAVARALVNQPQVILADEPTGQLDRSHGHQVMDHFAEIVNQSNTSVVVVTHDPEMAARCTRICSMRDGVLYEQ
ncbi:MAG: ABC transporter ATP-binding protein [Deltaproteobacteria bacterium]|nr:ABC transporter ATP-binding protein [Deltaproteobacteria bacterium]